MPARAKRKKLDVAWLCAGALLAAAGTAAMVNSSEAALFGTRTTGKIVARCEHYKGVHCKVAIPERPGRTYTVSGPYDARQGDQIAMRYHDDAVVPDTASERIPALAFLVIGLCVIGAFLTAAVARLEARKSPSALTLAVAVPVIFFAMIFTSCVASLAHN